MREAVHYNCVIFQHVDRREKKDVVRNREPYVLLSVRLCAITQDQWHTAVGGAGCHNPQNLPSRRLISWFVGKS